MRRQTKGFNKAIALRSNRHSTPVHGQIKDKTHSMYMVAGNNLVMCTPVDIPHIKLLTQNIIICILNQYIFKAYEGLLNQIGIITCSELFLPILNCNYP